MRNWAVVLAIAIAGYALTLYVFFPGVMTYDAKYIYIATKAAQPGDWQSPVMVAIWKWIDPLAPGAASMFLLIDHDLLGRLRPARTLTRAACAVDRKRAAGPRGASARLHPARHYLARYPVRGRVAFRRGARMVRARTGAGDPRPRANHRARFRRARNPAAAECVVRDPNSGDLYPLADGIPAQARGFALYSFGDRLLRAGAAGLLRRARMPRRKIRCIRCSCSISAASAISPRRTSFR